VQEATIQRRSDGKITAITFNRTFQSPFQNL